MLPQIFFIFIHTYKIENTEIKVPIFRYLIQKTKGKKISFYIYPLPTNDVFNLYCTLMSPYAGKRSTYLCSGSLSILRIPRSRSRTTFRSGSDFLVGSEPGYFETDLDPGISNGSGSGYFGRIQIFRQVRDSGFPRDHPRIRFY